MDCYCDYDAPSFYHCETRKARKQHVCSECHKAIRPGDQYEHVNGKWDDVSTFKTCSRCLDLKAFVRAHVPCFCWEHGNIVDGAIETAQEFGHEAPGLLFGAYRRKILIERHE